MGVSFDWPVDAGYEQFVAANTDALLRLGVLMTGNRYDAEDALQDAVIAVAERWSRMRPETALAYLRTALVRKAIDHGRRRARLAPGDVPDRAASDPGLTRYESDAEFVRMLQQLPDRQRQVLALRYYADVDDAAIASALGCSIATVRSQASRGLAKLRARLASESAASLRGGVADGSR